MKTVAMFSILAFSFIYADPDPTPPSDIGKVSEAFGHLIWKNLENSMGAQVDVAQLIKGLKDATKGLSSPMTEMECIQAIAEVQEAVFKKMAADNLAAAEQFLEQNSKLPGVQIVEAGRLHYKIEKEGKGAVVEPESTPLIQYSGTLLDGTEFSSSEEAESIRLDETLPGFNQGVIGMKEGEKRTLYIHPNLGFGSRGHLPPNSLLTFEVEVIQANYSYSDPLDATSNISPKIEESLELAERAVVR